MKTNRTARTFLALTLALTALCAAPSAFAHGPRVSIGIGFGAPYYPYYYRPYPYYYPPYAYYPAPVVIQQQPVYIEQNSPQPQFQPQPQAQPQAPSGYWYFCAEPNGYYPYVKECPTGWQRVAPQPSN